MSHSYFESYFKSVEIVINSFCHRFFLWFSLLHMI